MLGSQIELSRYDPDCRLQIFHRATLKLNRPTNRQREVCVAMAGERMIKGIGFDLGIAERTVKMHRATAIEALGVRNSVEAIRIAIEAGH